MPLLSDNWLTDIIWNSDALMPQNCVLKLILTNLDDRWSQVGLLIIAG